MLFQKIPSASMASKCTSTFFFSLLIFHFFSLAKKTIASVTFIFILCCPYEITTQDDNECNVCYCLLFFLWNRGKRQQPTHFILVFFFLHCKRQWWASPLIIIFYNSREKKTQKPIKGRWTFWLVIILYNPRKKKPWCWFFLGCRTWQWTSQLVLVFQTNYVHTKWIVEKCRERTNLLVFLQV
jgi:hypothetical protein